MNRKLRVTLVSETWPPEVNGVAMTMARLANGLRERGHTVHIVRPRQKIEAPESSQETLVRGLPLPGYKGLQFGLPADGLLRKLWAKERPDVVHAVTEGPLGWSALSAAKSLSIPLTSSYHTHFDGYSKHYGASFIGPLISAWLRRFHRRTLATMAPTTTLVNSLTAAHVQGARLLGRGVDTELFTPQRRSDALRAEWGAGPDDLVVMNVGRLAPEKNLKLAASAFEAMAATNPSARMVWVGDGPTRAGLEKKFPQHAFTGSRHGEDLARCYASADIFLFPSLTETYGNVVPEAMASGLAVVAYHDAAAAELITSGKNGLTAEAGVAQAFIAAACRMANNPELRQHCRDNARQRVTPISWDSVIGEFESVLRAASNGSLQ
ncbi:glycosyltransferase family 1 protein [Uliginosibacterium flavum]|uniref:Glycosyltransferase family 1 protein n=1 Tax=Uliginosibacterium flavum TaxID=1396831 RepID=A0ABV2TGC1_9RHOO